MSIRKLGIGGSTLVLWVTLLSALALPTSASAEHVFQTSFGSAGEGAGQLSSPNAVAVNDETEDVYVADTGNHRVDEFTATGTFIMAFGANVGGPGVDTCMLVCNAGTAGSGPGEFEAPAFVAVDNSSGRSHGDVYVADAGDSLVSKFTAEGALITSWGKEGQLAKEPGVPFATLGGITVGSTGDLYVRDDSDITQNGAFANVFVFDQAGTFIKSFNDNEFSQSGVAVNSAGNTYAPAPPYGIAEHGPSGEYGNFISTSGTITGIADDPSNDDLYIDYGTEITRYNSSLELQETFGVSSITGITVGATSDIYAVDPSGNSIELFSLNEPFGGTGAPSNIKGTSATLNGRALAPAGTKITGCQFEYVIDSAYNAAAANPYSAGATAPCAPAPPYSGLTTVSAAISGLTKDSTYHFRIHITDAGGGSSSRDRTFETAGPAVSLLSSSNINSTSGTLEAQVNPRGNPTTYHFEYLTEAEFSADGESFTGPDAPTLAPVPDATLGSAGEAQVVQQRIQNLMPNTVYRYRVVAQNENGTTVGSSQTFTTQRAGGEQSLPDGRHWEMVSPPSKQGALIYALGSGFFESLNVQGSANGNAIAFMTDAPTEANPAGDGQGTMTLATRGKSEWSSQVITPPHAKSTGISIGKGAEYLFFSEDLSLGLNTVLGAHFNQLSPEATEQTPYIRSLYEHGDVEAHCSGSCYRPLVTATNTPPGTEFGETANGVCAADCGPQFAGATPDLSHVLLYSPAKLTTTPVRHSRTGLYEWGGGKLQLVSVLPKDESGEGVYGILGGEELEWRHAVSDDGSRVAWEHEEALYVRDTTVGQEETIRLDLPQGGPGESSGVHMMIGNSDLSRIFFLDSGQLTANATVGGTDLYEYNFEAPQGSRLNDLTRAQTSGEVGGAEGVLGASEDGSYVYYAKGGEIFEYHDGTTTSVAAPGDAQDWGSSSLGLEQLTARVSPNGAWLAFQSSQDLTGYDTRDAVSGVPDLEVYLYNGETHKLVCASCNPTGARPVGRFTGNGITASLLHANRAFDNTWIAAEIPPWSRFNSEESRYQSRYLSNGGRLFFDSNDALVPQDVNGTVDVYEYEPPGEGSCSAANATFSARSEGCVGLISSGTSAQESSFLDASETGGDVFFMTTASLLPQDVDSAYDIYDAHECTSEVSCYPAAPVLPPACDTGESCKAAESPQPAIFGSPSSETFSGAGNITPSSTMVVTKKATKKKTAGCAKGKKLSHGKCVKAKAKGKKARARKSSNDRRVIR